MSKPADSRGTIKIYFGKEEWRWKKREHRYLAGNTRRTIPPLQILGNTFRLFVRNLCCHRVLAYYQDYIDEQIIPKTVRRKNQLQPGALTDILRLLIQPHGLPTIAWQVAHGLSRFFTHFDLPYRGVPQFSAAGSEPANGSIKANR